MTKSVRRGEAVNLFYYKSLFADVTALYRLDQIATEVTVQEFGPLPDEAVVLVIFLGACWISIGGYVLVSYLKNKKKKV